MSVRIEMMTEKEFQAFRQRQKNYGKYMIKQLR